MKRVGICNPGKLVSILLAALLSFCLVGLSVPSAFAATAKLKSNAASSYPWAPKAASGDYIADNYADVTTGHVFESVTQERLLDILSSSGNYYILFGGPSQATTQTVLAAINEQAKTDGITKIYHFDPLIDGFQADITKSDTPFKTTSKISLLWTRVTDLLPDVDLISKYDSADTLLFLYNQNSTTPGTRGTIKASYSFEAASLADTYSATDQKLRIATVFKGGTSKVIAASVRSDLQFFNRVFNASATRIEGKVATLNRIGKAVTLFDGLTEASFKLHQINFVELQNLYNTPGEHLILFGASWCHNTQAIIGTIAAEAATNPDIKTVYVYDTTLGNQITYGTGANINVATATNSTYNSRNTATAATANNNVSYIYGEAVRPLGNFITENNSYKKDQIAFFANGDLSGAVTSVKPYEATAATAANQISAIRLQLPFLIAYNKDATTGNKAVRQWLHQQKTTANAGRYLEYMLELAWVRAATASSAADAATKGVSAAYASITAYGNGDYNDEELTYTQIAREAIEHAQYVLNTGKYSPYYVEDTGDGAGDGGAGAGEGDGDGAGGSGDGDGVTDGSTGTNTGDNSGSGSQTGGNTGTGGGSTGGAGGTGAGGDGGAGAGTVTGTGTGSGSSGGASNTSGSGQGSANGGNNSAYASSSRGAGGAAAGGLLAQTGADSNLISGGLSQAILDLTVPQAAELLLGDTGNADGSATQTGSQDTLPQALVTILLVLIAISGIIAAKTGLLNRQ
jgi:hypothetical protein